MKRVLFLSCGAPDAPILERFGPFQRWFEAAMGPSVRVHGVDVRTEPLPTSLLDAADFAVISGSAHSAYEQVPWITRLEALVREAVYVRELPLLGVCFGHQVLARACGGTVVRNPRGREIGTVEIEVLPEGRERGLFVGLSDRFAIQVTHSDTVSVPPPGASVLARSALDDCQAFLLGTAWGVQFHPEVTAEVIHAYLEHRRAVITSEGLDVDALSAKVRESTAGRTIFANFLARRTT